MNTKTIPNQVCVFCVMDTSIPGLKFDANGQCECCRDAISRRDHEWWPNECGAEKLRSLSNRLKKEGRGRKYDCMIGLSGGIDSAYLAHIAVRELGLRVLAVHVDGGWNSEPAVHNIELLVRTLELDLFTYVVEWDEMRDMQRAFLQASVLNQDIPQDHLFFSTLYQTAQKFEIRHFLSGVNYASESVVPPSFGYPYSDDRHLRGVHNRFGKVPLATYPVMPFWRFLWLTRVRKQLHVHRPLNYLNYNKDLAMQVLQKNYGWRDYGSKHSESRFTKFYQDIFLPRKFGFDKRRLHLSSLIVSGQITRDKALFEIGSPIIESSQAQRDIRFVAKKIDLGTHELMRLIDAPVVPHTSYPNLMAIFYMLNLAKRILRKLKKAN